jgi:hypothetical protein
MLSKRLVRLIEDHAEGLSRTVLDDVLHNPRTASLRNTPHDELRRRAYDVYHNLGHWLIDKTEDAIERTYAELGHQRFGNRVPLSEMVYALIIMKLHLRDFIRVSGVADSAVELYQEEELHLLVDQFFDRATYYAVKGYEQAAEGRPVPLPERAAG